MRFFSLKTLLLKYTALKYSKTLKLQIKNSILMIKVDKKLIKSTFFSKKLNSCVVFFYFCEE